MERFKITPAVKGEKVTFSNPGPEFYEAVGGEEGMRKLMYHFYDLIYESDIHNFFPQDPEAFQEVKEKNTKFFIQRCGGPKLYNEADAGEDLDHYMMRFHDDFSINEKARVEWLGCMREALKKHEMDEDLKLDFWNYVEAFSKLTVNQFPEKRPNPWF
ncbi:MAG TPA: globin [Campylobacteraceae bacterium]|nr:globin [Campylobacteraceae bacterium]HHD83439.1 globin [Campylobacteraceae bacterium]